MSEEQSNSHVSSPNSSSIQLLKTQCTLHPVSPIWEGQVFLGEYHRQLHCHEIVRFRSIYTIP